MKKLSDGTVVHSGIYYYLLAFNERDNWTYLLHTINKERLCNLTISEFTKLYAHATETDLKYLKSK